MGRISTPPSTGGATSGVTSVATGSNLTGGPITTTGTLNLAGTISPTMIGTTSIQGGTIANAFIGTSQHTGGTITSPVVNGGVTLTTTSTEMNLLAGFPASVNVLGDRSGASEFIQRGTANYTCGGTTSSFTGTLSFPVAFTTLKSFAFSTGPSGNFAATEMPLVFYSSVSAGSITFFCRTVDSVNWLVDRTLTLYWIAVGT